MKRIYAVAQAYGMGSNRPLEARATSFERSVLMPTIETFANEQAALERAIELARENPEREYHVLTSYQIVYHPLPPVSIHTFKD